MTSNKLYALIDCNNFYASCEQLFDPKAQGRPLIVLSNNDGCIVSRSKEAKALEIPMAGPLFKNRHIIKKHNVVVRSSNYALYGDISARIMSTLAKHTSKLEPYSIDEAFIELTSTTIAPTEQIINELNQIRNHVTKNIGIQVSIGASNTKTRSKIANEIAKKAPELNGVYYIPPHIPLTFFKKLPIKKVWGIGYRNTRKLEAQNIHTAYDLIQKPDNWIRKQLTIQGLRTAYEIRGTPCLEIEDTIEAQKNINVSRSFGKHVTELPELQESIAYYTSIAAEKLRKQNLLTTYIYVYLATGRHRKKHAQYKNSLGTALLLPTDKTSKLITSATALIKKLFRPGFIYYKTGICLCSLTSNQQTQTSILSSTSSDSKQNTPDSAIDALNLRFGSNTITYAATGINRPWHMKREFKSPSYTTNWRELPIARAN